MKFATGDFDTRGIFKADEYREKAGIIEDKLNEKESIIVKFKDYIKYKNIANSKLKQVRRACKDPKNIDNVLSDYFTRELIMMYACVRYNDGGINLHFDIDGYAKCLEILEKPDKEYNDMFVKQMIQLAPTYIWSWKIRLNLFNLVPEALKNRSTVVKEMKNELINRITENENFAIFMQALNLRDKLLEKLTLMIVKRVIENAQDKGEKKLIEF